MRYFNFCHPSERNTRSRVNYVVEILIYVLEVGTMRVLLRIANIVRSDLINCDHTLRVDKLLPQVLTKDSVTVSVDAVVYYRVSNATVSVANVENAHHSTRYTGVFEAE